MNEEKTSWLKSSLLGFFIGLAIIIPGFSGAQITILFKMYDKLMAALSKIFSKKSILFLLPIVVGVLLGFILGLFTVKFLLEISTFAVVALFAGMMLGGIPSIYDEIKEEKFARSYIINFIIGLIIPLSVSIVAIHTNWNLASLIENIPWYMYLIALGIGFLIALTQLIPGLSATALLMSFGLYNALLSSISISTWKENPLIILLYFCFFIGAVLGVLLISKGINSLLKNYKTGFYYFIIGLCLSSIITMFYNPEILNTYRDWNNYSYIHLVIGIVLFILGTGGVYFGYQHTKKQSIK